MKATLDELRRRTTTNQLTERPILFSGPMVRAILEGRKTQTRRVLKPQPFLNHSKDGNWWFLDRTEDGDGPTNSAWREHDAPFWTYCPYGVPGDRLWVRETLHKRDGWPWEYGADNDPISVSKSDETAMLVWAHHKETSHCPSIHMPRWASRITLEIVKVRVERVQDISEVDAGEEGVSLNDHLLSCRHDASCHCGQFSKRDNFRQLWDSINAKRGFGWDKNPWVWVVKFKRLEGTEQGG